MDLHDEHEIEGEPVRLSQQSQRLELITFEHDCTLRDEPHYLTNRIESPQSCAFRFREWFLIDPRHPQTVRYYTSSYLLRSELVRHIKSRYWFMIHPFSRFRFYWEIWLVLYTYALMLAVPFTIAFTGTMRRENYVYFIAAGVNLLSTAEIVVNCLTGFSTDQYYQHVRLGPWDVFVNYLKGMFVIDFIYAFPASLFARAFIRNEAALEVVLNVVSGLLLFKVVSLWKIWRYIINIFERFRFEMINYYKLRLILISGLFIHWCNCFYKIAATVVEDPQYGEDPLWDEHVKFLLNIDNGMMRRYGHCFSTVLYYLFVMSFGEIGIPTTVHGKVLGAVCIIVGICFQLYLILQFFKLTTMTNSTKRNYAESVSQLQAYMGMKQFPKEMANRLMFYYEKKFEKCYFDEDKILSTLSEPLRHQIDDHSAARFYTTVPVFKDVPRSLLLALVRNMEKEIYLPNDMIVKAGSVGSWICFIHTGSVAAYTQSGKEIFHLYDGDHFGEISLFLKNKRLLNVIAIEFTQIFVLRRKAFIELVPPENALYQRLEEKAKERMQQILLEEELYKSHLLMVDGGGAMTD
ncbi:potassium/sodium hyperpolarization-activated cyclic nucleotide-gated channel 1-like isoform X1 [Culex pipiens pallens]|uniref:potassium/sodium hyperpolarization-activated cyclic nucleotide-gated channel 1-like isoform X1 n=1 Tax=Culex pipiens pallens TaxID=42434 RepID=UPI00195464B2|nr:potassium/sodium hyperpolarization-activated cyclic nucleotide-gated channel 1-like isoform X1 [Culex pipiens pallens]